MEGKKVNTDNAPKKKKSNPSTYKRLIACNVTIYNDQANSG